MPLSDPGIPSKEAANADRLRRAEAPTAADRRGVSPTRHTAPRSRRTIAHPGHPELPLGTRTARRSHSEEAETPPERPDGEHHPASPQRRTLAPGARLRR